MIIIITINNNCYNNVTVYNIIITIVDKLFYLICQVMDSQSGKLPM